MSNIGSGLPDVNTGRISKLLELQADATAPMLPSERTGLASLVSTLLARPIPDVTVNVGYIVRAVLPGGRKENGLLETWWVAAENDTGDWVTWEAMALDGEFAGRLGYNAGRYFTDPDAPAANQRGALADLAVRAGQLPAMAHEVAAEITSFAPSAEDKRAARRLRNRYPVPPRRQR